MRLTLFGGLRPFTRGGTIRNAFAGVTLASMNIPQVLGYTRIAGTPAVTGLYTVLLPLVGFAVFGSSRHLVVAADSATAAIFHSSLSHMAPPGGAKYMALVSMVALLTAAFLLLARIFKLGFLADFLSRTVLVGFLAGVGLQVGISMLGDMLGLSTHAGNTIVQAWRLARTLPHANLPTVVLAVLVAISILLGNSLFPHVPLPLVAVIGTIAASAAFHFAAHGIAVVGPVPGGLPALALPAVTWSESLALLPVAGSCFVMIIAQSAATSRAVASRYRETLDEDADILGLAAANAVAALAAPLSSTAARPRPPWWTRGARSQVSQSCSLLSSWRCCSSSPDRCNIYPAACWAPSSLPSRRAWSTSPACARSAGKAPASSSSPPSPPSPSWALASSKASCSRSPSRCSATSATAIARTRCC